MRATAFVSTRPFDLRTAAPFGISRWTHSDFERFVVELRDGDLVGLGEAAPNARYGEDRARDMDLLADLAPDIADLEGPAGVEMFCEGLAAAGVPGLGSLQPPESAHRASFHCPWRMANEPLIE